MAQFIIEANLQWVAITYTEPRYSVGAEPEARLGSMVRETPVILAAAIFLLFLTYFLN